MDPTGNWAQDVLRCDLCEAPSPPKYCDICDIHLCTSCVKEHLFNDSTEHKVVPIELRGSSNPCLVHAIKICEKYCQQCNIPICTMCTSSTTHKDHELVDILETIESKKSVLERDLHELESYIYPKYHEIASNFSDQMVDSNKHLKNLIPVIDKHGEDLHKEIDFAIQKLKSDLEEMDSKYLAVLNKQENEITTTISSIKNRITEIRKLLITNDVCLLSAYKSGNAELRRLPPALTITLPSFKPQEITKEHIFQHIGTLSELSVKTEEHGYTMDFPGAKSFPADRPLMEVPRVLDEIKTKYGEYKLRSVSCIDDDNIWTCGVDDRIIRLYILHRELLFSSIYTTSGNWPTDIVRTRNGDLFYTDKENRTVTQVTRDMDIEYEIAEKRNDINLQEWRPLGVCSTSSGDLLVVMDCDRYAHEETKVVRYCGLIEKQSIQYNDNGQPLYSFSECLYNKYITENKNQDICVSDNKAGAVVVVNHAGKLRFIYTGSHCSGKKLFSPLGIASDSQSRIITADFSNDCVHILDQDGQFLKFIDNCALSSPYGLCVDKSDNLFVAENASSKVKKIKYSRIQRLVDCQMYRPIELVILSDCTKL